MAKDWEKFLKFRSDTMWFLVVIHEPKFLTGDGILKVFETLLQGIKFSSVIFDDITGGEGTWVLENKEDVPINEKEFFELIAKVKNFQWGDFLFFKERPENWEHPAYPGDPYVTVTTEMTIRAVNGEYLYIYTRYEEVLNIIKENYRIESIKLASLKLLDYPNPKNILRDKI